MKSLYNGLLNAYNSKTNKNIRAICKTHLLYRRTKITPNNEIIKLTHEQNSALNIFCSLIYENFKTETKYNKIEKWMFEDNGIYNEFVEVYPCQIILEQINEEFDKICEIAKNGTVLELADSINEYLKLYRLFTIDKNDERVKTIISKIWEYSNIKEDDGIKINNSSLRAVGKKMYRPLRMLCVVHRYLKATINDDSLVSIDMRCLKSEKLYNLIHTTTQLESDIHEILYKTGLIDVFKTRWLMSYANDTKMDEFKNCQEEFNKIMELARLKELISCVYSNVRYLAISGEFNIAFTLNNDLIDVNELYSIITKLFNKYEISVPDDLQYYPVHKLLDFIGMMIKKEFNLKSGITVTDGLVVIGLSTPNRQIDNIYTLEDYKILFNSMVSDVEYFIMTQSETLFNRFSKKSIRGICKYLLISAALESCISRFVETNEDGYELQKYIKLTRNNDVFSDDAFEYEII